MPTVTVTAAGESASADYGDQPVQYVEFSDFAAPNKCGLWLGAKTPILGTGADPSGTAYRMRPDTSTAASLIPVQGSGQTNPYRLLRGAGMSATARLSSPEYGNLTIEGTDQGHLYGGFQIGYSSGAHVHDLAVSGIPGNAAGPPGETFSLELWHADGALIENVSIDGQRASDGALVAATLLGINTVNGLTVRNYVARNAIYGMAIAVWDSSGVINVTDMDARYCRHPVNFEQVHDGAVATFTRTNVSHQRDAGPAFTFNSTLGKAQLWIVDPISDRWPIRVGVVPLGTSINRGISTIDPNDVHLIIGGVDVSADTTKLIRHY